MYTPPEVDDDGHPLFLPTEFPRQKTLSLRRRRELAVAPPEKRAKMRRIFKSRDLERERAMRKKHGMTFDEPFSKVRDRVAKKRQDYLASLPDGPEKDAENAHVAALVAVTEARHRVSLVRRQARAAAKTKAGVASGEAGGEVASGAEDEGGVESVAAGGRDDTSV